MPIYEYECSSCGKRIEAIQSFADPPLTSCSECGGSLRKLLSAPAFQFKGSGWYVTDYTDRGKSKESESSEASKGESKEAVASGDKEGGSGTASSDASTSSSGGGSSSSGSTTTSD